MSRSRIDAFMAVASVLFLLVSALSGCVSVRVTPEAIQASGASSEVRAHVESVWREAVGILNDFLSSPYNLSLPRGRYVLDYREGLRFETEQGVWPITVTCDWLGDLIHHLGGQAASMSRGFVVPGTHGPTGDRTIDNTLFQRMNGEWKPAHRVASVTVHETGHLVHGRGILKNVGYACEVIFLFRRSSNSAETRPRSISVEFQVYLLVNGYEIPGLKGLNAVDLLGFAVRDLLEGEGGHGPYLEPSPQPPLPGRRSLSGPSSACLAVTEFDRWIAHAHLVSEWCVRACSSLAEGRLRTQFERQSEELLRLTLLVSAMLRRGGHDVAELSEARARVLEAFERADRAHRSRLDFTADQSE